MAMQLLEPFANDGLREDFDINPSPENDMSINKGFTGLFTLKPEEGGKFIDMLKFNQLLYLMSKANVEFTTQAFPNWIDDKGDGLPYAYPKNAIVKYTNGNNYVSLVNNNTQVPTGANWKLFKIEDLIKIEDFTGANQSLSENGYQKLPGGLILQWGASSVTKNIITFPIAFPTACINVLATTDTSNSSAPASVAIANVGMLTNTNFECNSTKWDGTTLSRSVRWIAIGY